MNGDETTNPYAPRAGEDILNTLTSAGIPATLPTNVRQDDAGRPIYENNDWWMLYDYYKETGQFSSAVLQSGLLTEIVNYQVTNGSLPPDHQLWAMAKRVGLNPSSLAQGTGSAGKSAQARANDIRNLTFVVSNQASKLGLKLSADAISYIATVAERQDYSSEQLASVLVDMADWEQLEPGTLKVQATDIDTLAKQYLVSLSPDTVREYSKRIAAGSMSIDTVTNIIRQQARQAMPWLSSAIDSGLMPSDILASGRDQIARGLELNPADIDLSDGQYMQMLTVEDPKSGMRLATNSEIERNIRKDNRWQKTQAAREMAAGMGQMVARVFGRSTF